MKRILTSLILLTLSALSGNVFCAPQNNDVAALLTQIKDKRVICEYSYSSGKVKGNGTATIQNGMYMVRGNGLEIYSNGVTRWTVDTKAKEVYIENAGEENDIFANLEQYLSGIEGLRFDGKTMSGTLRGDDGSALKCKATNIKSFPAVEGNNDFSFNTKSLDSSWVITDLR